MRRFLEHAAHRSCAQSCFVGDILSSAHIARMIALVRDQAVGRCFRHVNAVAGAIALTRRWRSRPQHQKRTLQNALLFNVQSIANTRLRENKLRVIWRILKLLAQMADIDTQVLCILGVCRPPHRRHDLAMRQHLPGMTR